MSPWFLREKSGVNFFWSGITWDFADKFPNFHILTGVVDYRHQHWTNVNIFYYENDIPYQYDIEANTPMVQIVPLSDRIIEPHVHVISRDEYQKLMNGRNMFNNTYYRTIRNKELAKESK